MRYVNGERMRDLDNELRKVHKVDNIPEHANDGVYILRTRIHDWSLLNKHQWMTGFYKVDHLKKSATDS